MVIDNDILKEENYIIELRKYFHMHPELSGKEYKTAERIEHELDDMGIIHEGVDGTGVAAFISGTFNDCSNNNKNGDSKRKKLVLRADIDALHITEKNDVCYKSVEHEVMHACGHDAHTAALLGAAKILNEHKSELNGDITLIFQHSEEIGAGAKKFIEAGYLRDADRVFGIHMASFYPVGKVAVKEGELCASCDYFKITVKGKSAHVSRPHQGKDAIYVASQIVINLQAIASRITNPLDSIVVGIGKMTAGTNYNIIADSAVLEGTTRAFNQAVRENINKEVIKIAKCVGEIYDVQVDVEFAMYAPPIVNDKQATEEMYDVAKKIVGDENVISSPQKNMMADDYAEYLLKSKGIYVYVGSCDSKETGYPHHNERFDVAKDSILIATSLYTNYAKYILKE